MSRLQELQQDSQPAGNSHSHSVFVHFMRLFLPLTAMAIIMLLFLWPQLSTVRIEPLNESDLQDLKKAESENRLLAPVFNTQDNKGRPMIITAGSAVQNRSDRDNVILVEPSASLRREEGDMTITGDRGQYNQAEKTISLQGRVILSDGMQNTLETEILHANIATGTAESDSPVRMITQNGVVEGQKIIIEDHGQKTIFQGPAKAVISSIESGSVK